jgi:hypothetical protein
MTQLGSQAGRDPNRPAQITITVSANQPALLEGLDVWLRLRLISNSQVRYLSQQYLVCALPELAAVTATTAPDRIQDFLTERPSQRSAQTRDFLVERPTQRLPQATAAPGFIAQRFQSLRAEVSVIWLLFLGVFMVVVSSGVLAASHWQNFFPIAQYGILVAYTLAFWAASLWTGRQANLHLTAQMLQITTLLIIPINFWLMDALRVWQQPAGWAIASVAALSLTTITSQLLQSNLRTLPRPGLLLLSSIGLSWLHWGWGWAGFPLIAVYAGTIAAAAALFFQEQTVPDQPDTAIPTRTNTASSDGAALTSERLTVALAELSVGIAALLLIIRALWLAQVPIAQLGLALGLCGWLLCWRSRQRPDRGFWIAAGAGLLGIGWLVSVPTVPWQAIAVSGLVIWLYGDRFSRRPQVQEITALFLVGLQAYWLLWRVLPWSFRQSFLAACAEVAGSTFTTSALAGVGFFPYIVLTLGLAARLRRSQPSLANNAEQLALGLGSLLTLLSLTNPLMRSLNLISSIAALALTIRGRRHPALVYLTHTVGLAAIASTIDLLFPDLSAQTWARILLTGMLAEWGLGVWLQSHLSDPRSPWQQSSWHLGLVLSGLSYVLLLPSLAESNWAVVWLVTPLALTLLAFRSLVIPSPRFAAELSTATLLLAQFLTFDSPTPRLLSLGMAAGLMVLNTRKLQQTTPVHLAIGFGLSFVAALIWQLFSNRLTVEAVLILQAIAIWLLWLLQQGFDRRNTALAKLYAQASNSWAIALSSLNLLVLTLYTLAVYSGWDDSISLQTEACWLWATGLTLAAIAYRTRQSASNFGFYGLAWGSEILVADALAIGRPEASLGLNLAIANLALGLAAQVAGDLWVARSSRPYRSSWHLIPITYAGLGMVLSHGDLTATTGLYTLAAALVGLGVGRRQPDFQPLTYLSLLAVSFAAYELLIYQLLQAAGGSAGDGVVLLAGLAIAIAVIDRLCNRWLLSYLRISQSGLRAIANLHWAGGGTLLLSSLILPLSDTGGWLWVSVTLVLAIDALVQGRSQADWIYAGITGTASAIAYALYLLVPETATLLTWAGAIAAIFAVGLYALPWDAWGWALKPWQRSAVLLPGAIVLLTFWQIGIPALLIVAAFYAWVAGAKSQVRLSYISLLLADWAVLRWLDAIEVQEPLWYASVFSSSLLYVAQIDPGLRSPNDREKRHLLRSLAVGLLCLTGIYQSETDRWLALVTLAMSVVLIVAGLSLRVRAFLYVGTAAFMVQILRQLWLLISDYSLLLWAIGIILGLAFIWIAATFESRRSQVTALVQYWTAEIDEWE